MKKRLFFASRFQGLIILAFLCCSSEAHAVIVPDFTFSGGKGAPLSITFNTTLTFQLTKGVSFQQQILVLSGVYGGTTSGDISGNAKTLLNAPAYTLNKGVDPVRSVEPGDAYLTDFDAGPAVHDVTGSDFLIAFTFAGRGSKKNDTYVFSSGQTITTNGAWLSNPANYATSFNVFLVDATDVKISNTIAVTAVPEPATTAALLGLSAAALVIIRRRRS